MNKIAVVYFSGTGNTEMMANAIVDGAGEKGAKADVFAAEDFSAFMMDSAVMSCAKTAIALMDIGMMTLAING